MHILKLRQTHLQHLLTQLPTDATQARLYEALLTLSVGNYQGNQQFGRKAAGNVKWTSKKWVSLSLLGKL